MEEKMRAIQPDPRNMTHPIQHRKGNAMKAFRLHEFGGPDALRREEVPDLTPGPGEVLIQVRVVSLNYRDLLMSRGIYNPKLKLPMVPISDGAGEVRATGAGVTRFKPGDQVVANFMPDWVDGPVDEVKARSALGGGGVGLLAEQAVLPEHGLLPIPPHLSIEEAATLPCAAVTAWNALVERGGVKPGDTVLVQGTGGVSLFALQFARLAGARVIATSSSDQKLARARELGATDGINYKTTPDWDKRARELTAGRGVDQIIEVGGAGTLPRSMRAVRLGGYIALIGVLSGASGEVNPMSIVMKSIRVQGIFVGSRAMFEAMNRAIETSRLRPVVDRVFDFEEAPQALKYLESGAHFGKVVVRI
jgi:NADPH:quinone reductase-like Zn-dependent oxidoreductase